MPIEFVGASYNIDPRTADVQRSVCWYPAPNESGSAKSRFMLKAIPGLIRFSSVGTLGRGAHEINGRAWVVVDSGLYELASDGTKTLRGTLNTSAGFVSLSSNTTQLYLVDGPNLYTLDLATNAFAASGDADFPGSDLTDYLDQFGIFAATGGQSFYITELGNAASIDALDFASAEAQPDYLVAFKVVNRELWLLGQNGCEVWQNTGATDFPIERNNGSIFGVGCSAKWTVRAYNNTLAWLGADKDGGDGVWVAEGYQGRRISNRCVEEAIADCTDLSAAIAYTQRIGGSVFYCLQLPGVDTTWCYDALTGSWHERAELVDGEYTKHRIYWTFRAFGKSFGLGIDGDVYEWSADANDNAGDVLCRDRISPHNALPDNRRIFYSDFLVDAQAGQEGVAMLRYSDDGGATWGAWDVRSLGGIGAKGARLLRWLRCGSGEDRVWHLRCTDSIKCDPVSATVKVSG